MSTSDKDPPYRVGYGSPPREHQFKKGVSGNPSGKRRKRTSARVRTTGHEIEDLFAKEADRVITALEHGKPVKIKTREALVRSVVANALRGDTASRRIALANMSAADRRRAYEKEEVFLGLLEYVAEWERTGFNPSDADPWIPDPRDFRFDHEAREYFCHTPIEEHHRQNVRHLAALRDIRQEEYDNWYVGGSRRSAMSDAFRELQKAQVDRLNALLPARMHRDLNPDYLPPNIPHDEVIAWFISQSEAC